MNRNIINGDVNFNGTASFTTARISATPSVSTDVANKSYVDSIPTGGNPPYPIPPSGRYMTYHPYYSSQTSIANAANTLRAYPFYVPATITVNNFATSTQGTTASTSFGMAFYNSSNGYPGNIVGSMSFTASFLTQFKKGVTFSSTVLSPGLYFVGMNTQGTGTFTALSSNSLLGISDGVSLGSLDTSWAIAATFSPALGLPSSFPVGAAYNNQTSYPIGALKIV